MLTVLIMIMIIIYGFVAHWISYYLEKTRIVNAQNWGLNICCGKTDGGGVNADIFQHKSLPNFRLVNNIYDLPFEDNEFDSVLCSHTMEHVDSPEEFFAELSRVGKKVTVIIPPLYDIGAVLNFLEHRYIFLSFRKKHHKLPKYIKLPFAEKIQKRVGQVNNA